MKNIPVKIWLIWKHQVPNIMACHSKLFPDTFEVKSRILKTLT